MGTPVSVFTELPTKNDFQTRVFTRLNAIKIDDATASLIFKNGVRIVREIVMAVIFRLYWRGNVLTTSIEMVPGGDGIVLSYLHDFLFRLSIVSKGERERNFSRVTVKLLLLRINMCSRLNDKDLVR